MLYMQLKFSVKCHRFKGREGCSHSIVTYSEGADEYYYIQAISQLKVLK